MLGKLAFRNVKRQASSYIIYFITVVFTVALMFAVNNVLFSKGWSKISEGERNIMGMLRVVTVLITFVVGFIICYATLFLLRKRKKEFGTYMLMGIKRSDILKIFFVENLIIGAASFVLGCILGLGVFQILNAIVCALMGNNFPPLPYAFNSIWPTLLQWAGMFFLAIAYSGIVLAKTKISGLIMGKRVTKKLPRFPALEIIIAVLMLPAMLFAPALVIWTILQVFGRYDLVKPYPHLDPAFIIGVSAIAPVILIVSVFVFYVCSRSFYVVRLKGKSRFKSANAFHYRQMSGALNANAVIMGVIALLLAFSFLMIMYAFNERYSAVANENNNHSFDVTGCWRIDRDLSDYGHKGSPGEVAFEAEKYTAISFRYDYYMYKIDDNAYHLMVRASDINAALGALGIQGVTPAKDGYFILFSRSSGMGASYGLKEGDIRVIGGQDFRFQGVRLEERIIQNVTAGVILDEPLIVVADDAFTSSELEEKRVYSVLLLNTKGYLPPEFYQAFADRSLDSWLSQNITSRYFSMDMLNADSSILIVSAMFAGVAFIFIAMAVLSLKALSDADLDKKRYAILNMLGVGVKRQRKIMFRQIFAFFIAPMLIPLFLAVPLGAVIAVFTLVSWGSVPASVYWIGAATLLVSSGIYLTYLAATYYLSVKSSIKPLEKPRVRLLAG